MAKANGRFFTRCSSIPRSKQQPRVLSPSVFCRRKAAAKASSLLRGSRGGSAAEHRFSFVVKVRSKRYHWSRIQPLSQALKKLKGLTAPLAQGSREARSVRLAEHRGAEKHAQFALPSTGEPRFALRSPFGKKIKSHHNFAFWGGMIFAEWERSGLFRREEQGAAGLGK